MMKALLSFRQRRSRTLEQKIGYTFRRKDLLEAALVHRSFRFENTGVEIDNQRLEFLGDAALGLVAAAELFRRFEGKDEGLLTVVRSRITNGKALADIARAIELGAEVKLGKGEEMSRGRERDSTLADALEAVVGAAYLDGGMKAVEKIFTRLFAPELDQMGADHWEENPKGRLQEISQRVLKTAPRYKVVSETGPVHARSYMVEVVLTNGIVGCGEGPSKRHAERHAATDALSKFPEQ